MMVTPPSPSRRVEDTRLNTNHQMQQYINMMCLTGLKSLSNMKEQSALSRDFGRAEILKVKNH